MRQQGQGLCPLDPRQRPRRWIGTKQGNEKGPPGCFQHLMRPPFIALTNAHRRARPFAGSRGRAPGLVALLPHHLQGMRQVGDEVFLVFEADGQADDAIGDAEAFAFFRADSHMGGRGRVGGEGFRVA